MTTQKNAIGDEVKNLIKTAETTIGKESPDDDFKPTGFYDLFKESEVEFADILSNSILIETARRYEENDGFAVDEQTLFKRLSVRASWAVFIATVTAALLTGYSSAPMGEPIAKYDPVAMILGVVALLTGAYAGMLVYKISGGGYLSSWMEARAAAETERLGYFQNLVYLISKPQPQQPYILLLSLELFRRYQLAFQQNYYSTSRIRHRKSLGITLNLGSVAAGILALCSGGAGILGYFEPKLLPIAAVGILGSALSTLASRREEMEQDERNAERYGRTTSILSHLREKHSAVQKAVAAGNTEVLLEYIHAVHEQLSLEHRQWLAQAEAIESAMEKLTASLKQQAAETESK